MYKKGKLDVSSFKYRIFTTKERKLCTSCRELIGIAQSLTNFEHVLIGSDHSVDDLNDHKPILSFFSARNENFL